MTTQGTTAGRLKQTSARAWVHVVVSGPLNDARLFSRLDDANKDVFGERVWCVVFPLPRIDESLWHAVVSPKPSNHQRTVHTCVVQSCSHMHSYVATLSPYITPFLYLATAPAAAMRSGQLAS